MIFINNQESYIMSWEDAFIEIYYEMKELNLQKEFDDQLEKMRHQDEHRHKEVKDQWSYAANKVKNNKKL